MTLTFRRGVSALQVHEDLPRAAMFRGVLQRLLHDAVHAERDVLRQSVRHVLVREREITRRAGRARAEGWRAPSGSPSSRSFAGCRRCDRSCTLLARPCARLRAARANRSPRSAAFCRSVSDQRDLLADVVVQLAGDARALVLLRQDQAAAQIRNLLVARAQLGLAGDETLPPRGAASIAERAGRRSAPSARRSSASAPRM